MKYGELNLGQVEAIVNKLGGMEGVRRFLGGEMTVSGLQAVFQVVVDYSHTLAEMIKAGHYDWVNDSITAEHFPISGQGRRELAVTLFHFNREMTSEQVIAEMDSQGFYPARIEVLLALGELQKQFPIVGLGSFWASPAGNRNVPFLSWVGSQRCLDLCWLESSWGAVYRFVAVCKSN